MTTACRHQHRARRMRYMMHTTNAMQPSILFARDFLTVVSVVCIVNVF